jgi:hypothetical protein
MRKITVGMVATVMGNVRNDIPVALEVIDELEKEVDKAYFEQAPFNTVEIIIEYGDNENFLSHVGRIVKKEILPVTAELKMEELIKMNKEQLYQKFKYTLLNTLLAVGKKYKLPTDSITSQLEQMSNVKTNS